MMRKQQQQQQNGETTKTRLAHTREHMKLVGESEETVVYQCEITMSLGHTNTCACASDIVTATLLTQADFDFCRNTWRQA